LAKDFRGKTKKTEKVEEVKKEEEIVQEEFYVGGFEENMTVDEACLILGLSSGDAKDMKKLTAAHRRIMLRNHPDRGGSPHLATKINEAKDLLAKFATASEGEEKA